MIVILHQQTWQHQPNKHIYIVRASCRQFFFFSLCSSAQASHARTHVRTHAHTHFYLHVVIVHGVHTVHYKFNWACSQTQTVLGGGNLSRLWLVFQLDVDVPIKSPSVSIRIVVVVLEAVKSDRSTHGVSCLLRKNATFAFCT